MINKIKIIKNLGIFSDYRWALLPDFKRFNVIYGWNGCGKTTLSNLFSILELGVSPNYPDLEYEIEASEGKVKQGEEFSTKVRVFNQEFVLKNVQILSGKANPIFILGEENKKIFDAIEADKVLLAKLTGEAKTHRDNLDQNERDRSKNFTDIARTISTNASGEATRKYDKRNAEEAFEKLASKQLLSETEIEKHVMTLRQFEKAIVTELKEPAHTYSNTTLGLPAAFKKIDAEAERICQSTVEAAIIDRLKLNSDLSNWVEEGVVLHSHYKSTTCEFCDQPIPEKRLTVLAKHFNDADKKLKQEIDLLINNLKSLGVSIANIKPIDGANLYEEMQNEYKTLAGDFEKVKERILRQIAKHVEILFDKKSKTTEPIAFKEELNADSLIDLITEINTIVSKHNKKTSNFKDEKQIAQTFLEKHYISTIFDETKTLDRKMAEENKLAESKNSEITEVAGRIKENKMKISSPHKACDALNYGVRTFLGRDDISFEVEGDGYVIKRQGQIAGNLSEGEKTAIAFVYFTVHLKDQDFKVEDGILVIDDPISSLDSNSLFQAFSFLKNSVKDAKQVFVLTHNFDFLRLLLSWLKYPKLRVVSNFYMINNSYEANLRVASIMKLDKTLEDHESEYHFLFKKLFTYVSDGTIETAYNMPNISRKLLETFLMFRVPNNEDYYKKLEELKNESNQNKLTAIYKFTNDQSHITGKGFDPSLVLETQKNVQYLLEFIEETFPDHYRILKSSI